MGWFPRKPQGDAVDRALRNVERQNRGMVAAAHFFAVLLVIATSVASLISLAGDVVKAVIQQHRGDIVTAASLVITLLLVMAMDTGSLYAAAMVRVLRGRHADMSEQVIHWCVMTGVSLLEAATYVYMLFLYEHPHDFWTWTLVIARGIAVPVLALYLAMAQPITVTPNDIAYHSGLFTGAAVLRDLVTLSNDPNAQVPNLARKILMYAAAADLSDKQRAKLHAMYQAATGEIAGDLLGDVPPVQTVPAPAVEEPSQTIAVVNGSAPGRVRFTPERAEVIERWALGDAED